MASRGRRQLRRSSLGYARDDRARPHALRAQLTEEYLTELRKLIVMQDNPATPPKELRKQLVRTVDHHQRTILGTRATRSIRPGW